MKTPVRRYIALLTALVLCFSLLPAEAFAGEETMESEPVDITSFSEQETYQEPSIELPTEPVWPEGSELPTEPAWPEEPPDGSEPSGEPVWPEGSEPPEQPEVPEEPEPGPEEGGNQEEAEQEIPAVHDNFLTFSSPTAFTINLPKYWNGKLFFSTDAAAWNEWDGSNISAVQNPSDARYYIYLRGEGNTVISKNSSSAGFEIIGSNVACTGNIESLLDHKTVAAGNHPLMSDYCFYELFSGCTVLTNAPTLPAPKLTGRCYAYMFSGCTNLISAPALPATTLAVCCYSDMFSGCTNLTSAPALPATTLASACYCDMFSDCINLIIAPALPAMTLANECYRDMFSGCIGLTSAPALPATTLSEYCYKKMFSDCTGLTSAPTLPATTLDYECCAKMFYGCTNLTSAPALPATRLADACYEEMFGNCTSLTTIPVLPATKLADSCYGGMFYNCKGIKLSKDGGGKAWGIPTEAIPAPGWNSYMFFGTGGSFTGDPEIGELYFYEEYGTKLISECTITLSESYYSYDGTAKRPTVTVTDGDTKLELNKDYSVAYNNNTNPGTASVTVTGLENYSGMVVKNFTIGKISQTLHLDISLNEINIGETAQIIVSGAKTTYRFSSSDADIATVNNNGLVTGIAAGKVTITVTAAETRNYNSAKETVSVTVVDPTVVDPTAVLALPAALKKIEAEAFEGVTAEVIVVPASVTEIGPRAFANCKNLREVIFRVDPNTVKISENWLDGCGEVEIIRP